MEEEIKIGVFTLTKEKNTLHVYDAEDHDCFWLNNQEEIDKLIVFLQSKK